MRRRLIAVSMVGAVMLGTAGCADLGGNDSGGGDDSGAAAERPNSADEDAASTAAEGGGEAEPRDAKLINQTVQDAADRAIIYTIDLSLAVDDVPDTARKVATLASSSGGYIASEATDGNETSTITIKVPAEQHEDAVERLTDLGKVTSRSRNADDVTQQMVDTESRIKSQRASIARIRTLLGEATKIADIINIESELASREADLDALLQQQEKLSSLTSMATINVTLHRPEVSPDDDDPDHGFLAGLSGGWDAFISAGGVALTIIGAVIPFAVLGAVVGVPAWYYLRQRRRPVAGPTTPEPEQS